MKDGLVDAKVEGGKKGRSLPERLEELARAPSMEPLLAPASFVYGAGSYLRILSFSVGLSARSGSSVPVISVGNLTVGGTGKTPVVIDLADRLSSHGLKVAILSRGYGRKSKDKILVVSAFAGPVVDVGDAGDEPFMMARAVPDAAVIVGSKRVDLAKLAVEKYGAEIILLDDGFQHVQLKRDLDLVLFDYNDDPDTMALLPRGRLREPLAALGRASHIVITKVPEIKEDGSESALAIKTRLGSLRDKLAALAPAAVLHAARFSPSYLLQETGTNSEVVKLSAIGGKKIFAMCGIARPEGFIDSLTRLGATVCAEMIFSDHHWYSSADVAEIEQRFRESQADYIVTSEKDRVRLKLPANLEALTYALMIEPVWLDGAGLAVARPQLMEQVMALAEKGQ
jgi:tetraacyldisaccharide 4'-kinase